MDKENFLKTTFINQIKSIDENTKPVFGKMNVQQMIEHMSWSFKQASGLINLPATYNNEITEKAYRFMMSDKPFNVNTLNIYMPEKPAKPIHQELSASIKELEKDIEFFFTTHKNNTTLKILNPFFGNLNYNEWIQLLHKHALHHLSQFGINN